MQIAAVIIGNLAQVSQGLHDEAGELVPVLLVCGRVFEAHRPQIRPRVAGLDPLDTFTIQFQHTNGDLYMTLPALGGTVLGAGSEPVLLGGPSWAQDRGTSILVTIQPLRANLRIDVCLWAIEARGPANYQWPG